MFSFSWWIKPVFDSLESESVALINKVLSEHEDYKLYVLQSTGKDSMVVDHLCKMTNYNVQTVFNNTTLDCADTYRIVNQHKNEWIITTPEEGFYQYVKRANFIPARFSRGCCSIFKEGNHIKHFQNVDKAIWITGIRNEESNSRKGRDDISYNPKWTGRDWFSLQPIRKWGELEIWCYILYHGLLVNPKYKKGYRRCGCSIACPFASKTTWYLDQYWYPYQYNRWHEILTENFIRNGKWTIFNCTIEEFQNAWNGGVVREQPTEKVVREFMSYQGLADYSVAEKYFNKTCHCCGKKIFKRDDVAMNLKLYGRNIEKFKCKKCMMKELNINKGEWNKRIADFKSQGCALF